MARNTLRRFKNRAGPLRSTPQGKIRNRHGFIIHSRNLVQFVGTRGRGGTSAFRGHDSQAPNGNTTGLRFKLTSLRSSATLSGKKRDSLRQCDVAAAAAPPPLSLHSLPCCQPRVQLLPTSVDCGMCIALTACCKILSPVALQWMCCDLVTQCSEPSAFWLLPDCSL